VLRLLLQVARVQLRAADRLAQLLDGAAARPCELTRGVRSVGEGGGAVLGSAAARVWTCTHAVCWGCHTHTSLPPARPQCSAAASARAPVLLLGGHGALDLVHELDALGQLLVNLACVRARASVLGGGGMCGWWLALGSCVAVLLSLTGCSTPGTRTRTLRRQRTHRPARARQRTHRPARAHTHTPRTLLTISWRPASSLHTRSASSTAARSASTADVSSASARWNFSGDCGQARAPACAREACASAHVWALAVAWRAGACRERHQHAHKHRDTPGQNNPCLSCQHMHAEAPRRLLTHLHDLVLQPLVLLLGR
jgi:hypothetical protein